MRLWSHSWINGGPIPARCAAVRIDAASGAVVWSDNRHPHLAWDEVPVGTLSFALIAHDFDGLPPGEPPDGLPAALARLAANEDLPRVDRFHWVLVDLPADLRELGEGTSGAGLPPSARVGTHDFGPWLAPRAAVAADPGEAGFYAGPLPPPGDPLVHHYALTLHALDLPRVPLEGPFDGAALRRAIYPHVLAAATLSGTYSLHPRHRA